jgi:hypothetical protein
MLAHRDNELVNALIAQQQGLMVAVLLADDLPRRH